MAPLPNALGLARAGDCEARVPFALHGHRVGSVAREHLNALRAHPRLLRVAPDGVDWMHPEVNGPWADLNTVLREAGLVRAWRDELFTVFDPSTGTALAQIERAASRFWGTLTLGAHANGFVRGDGRAHTEGIALWIAQRAFDKATDPGLFDNLVGGGVPAGQTPTETLQREAWEEAGLRLAQVGTPACRSVFELNRRIEEGWQHEWLYAFDIELAPGAQPLNQDGEVAGFTLLPLPEAVALACGSRMTVDAALVTLDFAARHGAKLEPGTLAALDALRVQPRLAA